MIEVCQATDEGAHDLLIEGPTVRGSFFIRDRMGNIWDGEVWRGFGYPAEFTEFKDAFKARHAARQAQLTSR